MGFDISTDAGRKAAWRDLIWRDHGFLRVWFQNAHWISDEMVRSNQPSPEQIAEWAEKGIRTIINLRGGTNTGFHALEREACAAHNIRLENYTVSSRDVHDRDKIMGARDLFDRIEYPALMHCKSGADRAGFMAALYLHFRKGAPIDAAMQQLSFKYLHVKAGKTGMLDHFFQTYLNHAAQHPMTFSEWVENVYVPQDVKRDFMENRLGSWFTDKVLHRE